MVAERYGVTMEDAWSRTEQAYLWLANHGITPEQEQDVFAIDFLPAEQAALVHRYARDENGHFFKSGTGDNDPVVQCEPLRVPLIWAPTPLELLQLNQAARERERARLATLRKRRQMAEELAKEDATR